MLLIFSKLRIARNFLGMKQLQLADQVGVLQADISQIENGHRKFIYLEYLTVLRNKGIDLNALVDEKISLVDFVKNPTTAKIDALEHDLKQAQTLNISYYDHIETLKREMAELSASAGQKAKEHRKTG